MRAREKKGGFSLHAIAGSYVVFLGFDASEEAAKGLLGFAIERTDHTEGERYFLRGFKTFEEIDPNPTPGSLVSTLENPIQAFSWGDYTAKPNHDYTYEAIPLYGTPKKLERGPSIAVRIGTEDEAKGTHAVYFNRGVAGSQGYARKFGNERPDDVPDRKAFIWLSRGLEEALLGFIGQAKGSRDSLRAAVYEFNYAPVLDAFGAAADAGADVQIVYDARPGKGHPVTESDKAIKAAGIRRLMIKRTANPSYIAHNKFIVRLRDDKPVEVWTGSTNITTSGIFGQSNVGHIVRDPGIAQAYLDYWTRLSEDPEARSLRVEDDEATPDPEGLPVEGTTPIFSPRGSLGALEWYAKRMDAAKATVCFTAAFGVNDLLASVLEKDRPYLRFVLLEKKGDIERIAGDPDVRIAIGSVLENEGLSRWLEEQTFFGTHVRYIHTKYMLIDPLTEDPIVITGSANFSDASTKNNDENMLVIRGDTRVADIYLGEFMRLFDHFYFRSHVRRQLAAAGTKERSAAYLDPDDSWTKPYFKKNTIKEKTRLLFR